MKKTLIAFSLFCFSFSFAQEVSNDLPSFKRNELKGNALFLILAAPEFTYERLLDEESGVGVSVLFSLSDDINTKFSLTPFYRFYFGKKPAAGFFIEGFGMLNTYKLTNYDDFYYYDPSDYEEGKSITDVAFGFGIGGKWLSKKGVLLEINSGIGRNLFNNDNKKYENQFIGRGGVTIGYRF